MLHDYDTHSWVGTGPKGLLCMEDIATTADPMFSELDEIYVGPCKRDSFRVAFSAKKPPGYSLFFRHRPHQDMGSGQVLAVEYILGMERGSLDAEKAAALNLGELGCDPPDTGNLPIVDGFRAKLDLFGNVHFFGSLNWQFLRLSDNGLDIYQFGLR